MSPMQYRHRREYEQVLKYTEQLHSLMESGEFWDLSFFERRKLVRRVNKLYRRLAGIFALGPTKTALLAAGVLSLAACSGGGGESGGGTNDGNVTIAIDGTTQTALVVDALTELELTAEAVDISGTPTYQWFYDETAISGATAATLTYEIPKTINTTGLEDFYSPRGGAPNLHELKVEVTDSETAETFTATVDLTVRIDPEFSATWTPLDIGIYGEFDDRFTDTIVYGDLDGDGDIDALAVDSWNWGTDVVWFDRSDSEDIAFTYGGNTGLYSESTELVGSGYEYTYLRPAELMDLDGDGDADLIAGVITYYNGVGYDATISFGFSVFQNTPSGGAPVFDEVDTLSIPGIQQTIGSYDYDDTLYQWPHDIYSNPATWTPTATLVDMDADGDLDLLFSYAEYNGAEVERVLSMKLNTGTISNPEFGSTVDLVNGGSSLNSSDFTAHLTLSAGDVDLDGDIDVFATQSSYSYGESATGLLFFENTGTPDEPAFTESAATSPFGLDFYADVYTYYYTRRSYEMLIVDLDADGDLDIVAGWYGYYGNQYPVAFFNDSVETTRPDFVTPLSAPIID